MDKILKNQLKKYVPNSELHFLIKRVTGEEPKGYVNKDALIEILSTLMAQNPNLRSEINELIIKFKHAGKCSISWSVPLKNEDELSNDDESNQTKSLNKEKGIDKKSKEEKLTKEIIESTIIQKVGCNPFEKEIKPNITKKPSLHRAEWLRDNLLQLEFVYADRPQLMEIDYEIKEITPTKRASILVRLINPSIAIESRANFNKSSALHEMTSNILGVDTEILNFNYEDVEKLKDYLNANKKAARHKKSAGDFDTVEVTASPNITDLDYSVEYMNYLGNDELRRAMYKFKYVTEKGSQSDITFYINYKGSIWFLSDVPEEVIDYVFSGLKEIKGF